MAIETSCSNCGKVLRAKDSAAGKTAKCPDCGSPIRIPEANERDEFDFDLADDGPAYDPDDLPPLPVGAGGKGGASGGEKPCPACGEKIKAVAKKCRHCGEIFDAKLAKASRKASGDVDSEMSTGDWVVAALCPGIGCIAGIIWAIQGKPKAPKMIGISLLCAFVWNILKVVIATIVQQQN